MSITDSTAYWWALKDRQPYYGETFYHIGDVCKHYNPKSGNILTSKYLNDINCHHCKKLIEENGNIYDLQEGISPMQQSAIDRDKYKFRFGKCSKCGQPMNERTNKIKNTKFLGCSQYPKCKHTESIKP